MPHLNIVTAIDVSDEEATLIADALGCAVADLEAELTPFGAAALREYADMFSGLAMISVADLRERRMLAILLATPAANFPSDEKLGRLFNITTQAARALMRTAISRHRARVRPVVESAARAFLAACNQLNAGGEWEVRFSNSVIVEILNEKLANAATARGPIKRKPGTFETYLVPNGSHIELMAAYP